MMCDVWNGIPSWNAKFTDSVINLDQYTHFLSLYTDFLSLYTHSLNTKRSCTRKNNHTSNNRKQQSSKQLTTNSKQQTAIHKQQTAKIKQQHRRQQVANRNLENYTWNCNCKLEKYKPPLHRCAPPLPLLSWRSKLQTQTQNCWNPNCSTQNSQTLSKATLLLPNQTLRCTEILGAKLSLRTFSPIQTLSTYKT